MNSKQAKQLTPRLFAIMVCVLLLSQCASNTTASTQSATSASAQSNTGSQTAKQIAGKRRLDLAHLNVELGMGYLQKDDVQRAQVKLQQAMQQAPNDATVINAMAYFYSKTGQLAKANAHYQLALKKNPNLGLAHNNYGVFLCQHHQQEKGIQHFLAATQDSRYVKSAEAYENAGLCALQVNQTAKAWEYFQLSYQRDPRRSNVLMELARLAYQQGKYAQAQKYVDGYEQLVGPNQQTNLLTKRIKEELAVQIRAVPKRASQPPSSTSITR